MYKPMKAKTCHYIQENLWDGGNSLNKSIDLGINSVCTVGI